jgi:hypothetical protein
MDSRHQIGRLPFVIAGDTPVARELRREFQTPPAALAGETLPALSIDFVDQLEWHDASRNGWISVTEEAVHGAKAGFRSRLRFDPGAVRLAVQADAPVARSRLRSEVRKFRHWNYVTPTQWLAKNVIYDLFDYASQLAQTPLGQSYIHASAAEKDGRAFAILGWGGSGKSSTILQLVIERGWRFLSDDLGVLDADGLMHFHPKRLQVYAYNLEGLPRLRRAVLGERSPVDRASWAYHLRRRGPKGVRRRIGPTELFGADGVGGRAPLAGAVLLLRGGDRFHLVEADAEELARIATYTLRHELSPIGEVVAAVGASGRKLTGWETLRDWELPTLEILTRALETCPTRAVLRVPEAATPRQVLEQLDTTVLGDSTSD